MITWLSGLVRRRSGRMLPAILGVSLTIALLAILGIFINASAATCGTRREQNNSTTRDMVTHSYATKYCFE